MPGLLISFHVGGSSASGFPWQEQLFLVAFFLASKPSTLVWHSGLYTNLMSVWQTPDPVLRAVLFEGSSWGFGGCA